MNGLRFLGAAAAIILAGCVAGNENGWSGTFSADDAPAFTPPADGGVSVAELVALAAGDAGVRLMSTTADFGAVAIGRTFAGLKGGATACLDEPWQGLSLAMGESMMGKRSLVAVSSSDFARLAGELAVCAQWGCHAGVVVVVLDDVGGKVSGCALPTTALATATQLPNRAVSGSGSLYSDIHDAFLTSERLRTPFVLILNADELERSARYSRLPLLSGDVRCSRDVLSDVISPITANYRNYMLAVKKAGNYDEDGQSPPPLPVMPDGMPRRSMEFYRRGYEAMKCVADSRAFDFVAGEGVEIGFYAFEPLAAVDASGFGGSAIPLAVAAQANGKRALAVISDYDFLRYGAAGLRTAMGRIPVKVMILGAGLPPADGMQPADLDRLEALLESLDAEVTVCVLSGEEPDDLTAILREKAAGKRSEIIYVDCR